MVAAAAGHAEIVKLLLDGNADAALLNKRREDARRLAEFGGHQEVVNTIEDYRATHRWKFGLF